MPDETPMNPIVFNIAAADGGDRIVVGYADGGVVFVKGDPGDVAYIVQNGAIEVRGQGRLLEAVGPGGMFGEMALVDNGPRSASAVAVGPTELIVVDRARFDRLISDVPGFAMDVMRLMASRLRAANAAAAPPDPLSVSRSA